MNNGGAENARTDLESTHFAFEIVKERLEEALDIFANLLISPTLNEDTVLR